jgi:hypothetical protein
MKSSLQEFLDTLQDEGPPPAESHLLDSVWYGLKGSWDRAHEIAQDDSGIDAALIHAWLHRIKGDLVNAGYWYRQARREMHGGDTRAEGEAIAEELLSRARGENGKTS